MCGRFVSSNPPERIAEYFGASFAAGGVSLPENFNVAPTDDVYGVVAGRDGLWRVEAFRWGLVPSWAKDVKIGSKMINSRAETISEKPAFRTLFLTRRLIIPMNGFYEWRRGGAAVGRTTAGKPVKQPYFVHRADDEPMAVAGLWSAWRDRAVDADAPLAAAAWLHSCSVVTTSANAMMATIHDRMPVVLPSERWQEWLDRDNQDVARLQRLLTAAPDGLLTMHPVSTEVNNVRNNGAQLVAAQEDPSG